MNNVVNKHEHRLIQDKYEQVSSTQSCIQSCYLTGGLIRLGKDMTVSYSISEQMEKYKNLYEHH